MSKEDLAAEVKRLERVLALDPSEDNLTRLIGAKARLANFREPKLPRVIGAYVTIAEGLKAKTSDKCPLFGHLPPDIRFLKNVTGAFVAPGVFNPRASVAFFAFWHDGLLEPCALGLHLVENLPS